MPASFLVGAMPLEVVMEIGAKIFVTKAVADCFPSNPAHVEECVREAEATMNVEALKRKRVVSARPRLVSIEQSALGADLLELLFHAPTRAV